MIEIVKAPPYATVQDLGFPRGRAWGLPPGGAMDPAALAAANGFAGNLPGAAVIEWALGPLVVRCERDTALAALPMAEIRVGSETPSEPWPLLAPAQVLITLVPDPRARFAYLAVRGGLDLPMVLGSRSTYLPGGFGGFQGRRLRTGDRLPIGTQPRIETVPSAAHAVAAELLSQAGSDSENLVLRATRGPQWDRFDAPAQAQFFGSRFTVDRASDRSGYRLVGPPVPPRDQASLPSEPACPGAVQVPDSGQPIVLMPDGPTVGGYPKLAVVVARDLARLAQCQPGRGVRFREISVEAARAGLRAEAGSGRNLRLS